MLEDDIFRGVAHYGVAVPKIEEAIETYRCLGFELDERGIIDEISYGVKACVMCNHNSVLELLSPLDNNKESPVDIYLETKPYKIYHTAFYVSDIQKAVDLLKNKKFFLLGEPRASIVQKNRKTVFLSNRKFGIIELIEYSD